jgi:hypothetical protein
VISREPFGAGETGDRAGDADDAMPSPEKTRGLAPHDWQLFGIEEGIK